MQTDTGKWEQHTQMIDKKKPTSQKKTKIKRNTKNGGLRTLLVSLT